MKKAPKKPKDEVDKLIPYVIASFVIGITIALLLFIWAYNDYTSNLHKP